MFRLQLFWNIQNYSLTPLRILHWLKATVIKNMAKQANKRIKWIYERVSNTKGEAEKWPPMEDESGTHPRDDGSGELMEDFFQGITMDIAQIQSLPWLVALCSRVVFLEESALDHHFVLEKEKDYLDWQSSFDCIQLKSQLLGNSYKWLETNSARDADLQTQWNLLESYRI